MPQPGCFTCGKENWCPVYRRLSEPQDWSGRVLKISFPPGFDSWTLQPTVSRYTKKAILACITTVGRQKFARILRPLHSCSQSLKTVVSFSNYVSQIL